MDKFQKEAWLEEHGHVEYIQNVDGTLLTVWIADGGHRETFNHWDTDMVFDDIMQTLWITIRIMENNRQTKGLT